MLVVLLTVFEDEKRCVRGKVLASRVLERVGLVARLPQAAGSILTATDMFDAPNLAFNSFLDGCRANVHSKRKWKPVPWGDLRGMPARENTCLSILIPLLLSFKAAGTNLAGILLRVKYVC